MTTPTYVYAAPPSGGISCEQIVELYRRRSNDTAQVQARRMQVRDAYNGELRVSLPDIGRNERAAVANLLNTGLDQLAMRVSSTLPSIFCPPRNEQVKREVVASDKRRKALYGWWEANDFDVLVPRRARQMLAYAQSPVMLWPDFERGIPQWRMRDPLGTYPAHCMNPGDFTPDDCIFAYQQTYDWVNGKYPDVFERLRRKERYGRDDKLLCLDYVDDNELVTVVLGDVPQDSQVHTIYASGPGTGWLGSAPYLELVRLPNRAGICTAVVPGRITLDKMLGHFDGILGMYAMSARLMALEVIAVEKGVFPDTYLESRPGEQAKFLTGPHDGRTGLVNIVQGGVVREMGTNPGFQTNPTIDRLERAQRLTAGIPAEFGGESASNVRTGRRGENVLSAAVDFPVQEQQKVLAASLREENKRAIAVAKGYFGKQAQSFYVHWKGAKGQVDYTPDDVFTTDHNVVAYSHVGSDLNGLTIMVGQLVGMGAMSKQTAAELLPIIEDPEREHDRSIKEALEAAMLAAVQQKVNAGEIAPVDAAWLMQQVGNNKLELAEAVIRLDERVKQRQASAGELGASDGPVLPGTPEAMAGLAAGTPAEAQAVPPSIGGPNESQDNLASLLGRLRQPQMTLSSERPAV
jgi:hypothetical protein